MTQDADDAARSAVPRRPAKPEGKGMAGAVVVGLLAVAAFGGGMWFAYKEGYKAGAKHAPKVVAADASPTKSAPENTGGATVPHQDKAVYDVIGRGTKPTNGDVTIRQTSEEPVAKPQTVAEAPKSNGVGKPTPLFPPQAATKPAEPQVAAATAAPASAAAESPTQTAAILVPPPVPSAGAPSTGGGWRLQLASLRSEEAVQKSWSELQRKYSDVLGSLRPDVLRVDLGADKGVYYRLMVGPLPSRDEANARCEQLKAQKVACLVARN